MNKLPKCISVAESQAQHCLDKVEFFKTKSRSKHADVLADNFQTWAELWGDTEELLRELAMYRNACKGAGIEVSWETRLIEKSKD